jgi:hypothetical protein
MSHTVQIQTQIRDIDAVLAACQRLQLPPPVQGNTRLFSSHVTGLAVQLPDWNYPVVCQLDKGQIQFDNYGGAWGDPKELDRFIQSYAIEKARIEAHKKGYTVTEQPLMDGSIKLTIQVAGGAV